MELLFTVNKTLQDYLIPIVLFPLMELSFTANKTPQDYQRHDELNKSNLY
jgi:hypothetical protein